MFSFTEDQANKVALILSNLMLTVAGIDNLTAERVRELEAKAIVQIEKVINNQPTVMLDPAQEALPLQ